MDLLLLAVTLSGHLLQRFDPQQGEAGVLTLPPRSHCSAAPQGAETASPLTDAVTLCFEDPGDFLLG